MSDNQIGSRKKKIQQYSSKEANEICRECIQTALIRLMKTKELKDITITELTQLAGVSRTTYYRNYYEKEDVLQDLFTGLMLEISREILAAETIYDTALAVFQGIRKNADVYLLLMKADYAQPMLREVTRIASADTPEDQPLERMRIVFLTGALFNMVLVWADAGMHQTPEQMTDMYMQILKEPIPLGTPHAKKGQQSVITADVEKSVGQSLK